MNRASKLLSSAALIFAGSLLAGCYADVEPEPNFPDGEVEAYEGFRPMSYNGYVVYYDNYARPYYFAGGAPYWVPRSYVGYGGLVAHYNTYRGVYPHWYAHYGFRYRTYRHWR